MSAASAAWGGARSDLARWGLAFLLVLVAHGGLAAALLTRSSPPPDGVPLDAVAVDLTPEPSTETLRPDEVAGPEVTESVDPTPEPEPISDAEPPAPDSLPPETAETKPPTEAAPEVTTQPTAAASEVVLPQTPEQPAKREPAPETQPETKPVEKPDKPARQERRTAPSQARTGAAAPLSGGARPSSAAIATWAAKLGQHLAHHKRYPVQARARRLQGTAMLQVTLDGSGRVVSRRLVKGSGVATLDQESLAMMLRAQPLPKPPPNMPVPVTLTIPVRFSMH